MPRRQPDAVSAAGSGKFFVDAHLARQIGHVEVLPPALDEAGRIKFVDRDHLVRARFAENDGGVRTLLHHHGVARQHVHDVAFVVRRDPYLTLDFLAQGCAPVHDGAARHPQLPFGIFRHHGQDLFHVGFLLEAAVAPRLAEFLDELFLCQTHWESPEVTNRRSCYVLPAIALRVTLMKGTVQLIPPSTRYSTPLTKRDSSEARNSAIDAISSGSPSRGEFRTSMKPSSISGVDQAIFDGVCVGPGRMALLRMPRLPKVAANACTNQLSAAFEAP